MLMLCNDRQIDRRILLQADSLEEDGWRVTILAMPLDGPVILDDPRVVRIGFPSESVARRENRVLQVYRLVRRYLPMNGQLMRVLKSFAWRFLVDHERFYLNLFLADGRQHVADIVVAHDLPMLTVGRALASEFGARLIYDSHELYSEQEFSRGQQASWAKIERRHIHACDQVITVNPSIARELETRYGLTEVAVIHNAERISSLGPRSWYLHECFGIPREHRVLLFQGGFSAGRNLLELVEAMVLLRDSDIHLVLLGDGQLADAMHHLIKRKGLQSRVHLHPAVSQARLLEVTAAADAGVIPYQAICLNNYYCTPNKLFEFIAAGIPILASDLPELRRLVEGNQIGCVGDLATPLAMAKMIEHFFADELRLQRWRQHLFVVRQELSWQKKGEHLKRLYREFR
ncbi:Glycosyltransferase involved in cell wall bisynthesis [Pseudomonas anguilliseptica]|uniref:Glycosyltransferase involved in cell wall bisynthesis n=1 Tax=Pseudomonas anguilliseptica TaxID=53406 RepID=A0A1H4QLZ9_PSEAG|nr:Glycosyltransferase involved in cell wall bisynthesis [Pseudomonas anguilliseptica]